MKNIFLLEEVYDVDEAMIYLLKIVEKNIWFYVCASFSAYFCEKAIGS